MKLILNSLAGIDRIIFKGRLRVKYFEFLQVITFGKLKKSSQFQYTVFSLNNYAEVALTKLSQSLGSDKGSTSDTNPYPWQPHTYTSYYNLLFSRQRDQISRVFECGIGSADESIISNMGATGATGASLRMWRDYFPNAHIVGGDIDPKAIFQEERISSFLIDQTDPVSIQRFWGHVGYGNFDLMIDDGLHSFTAGKTLFENSIQHLSKKGIYVIEDVNIFDLLRYKKYFDKLDFNVSFICLYSGKNSISDDCLITIQY
jgi:hypothetical protein